MYRRHAQDEKNDRARSVRGLSEAYRFACNDAKFLSRYFQQPDSDYMLTIQFLFESTKKISFLFEVYLHYCSSAISF